MKNALDILALDILGVGIAAPGIPDWSSLLAILDGHLPAADSELPKSALLSPRERRRAPATVKLSFAAAEQACKMAGIAPDRPATVFSSAMGDLEINDYMCRTLAESPRALSPTRFHNSVHNAAAGYWSIGAGSRGDVTAIAAWRDTAVAGLVESAARVASSAEPVLLVVYDDCAQGPMRDLWPTRHPFAAALLMASAEADRPALARLRVQPAVGPDRYPELPALLDQRMADNPAARIMPLLALIASNEKATIHLAAEGGTGLQVSRLQA